MKDKIRQILMAKVAEIIENNGRPAIEKEGEGLLVIPTFMVQDIFFMNNGQLIADIYFDGELWQDEELEVRERIISEIFSELGFEGIIVRGKKNES